METETAISEPVANIVAEVHEEVDELGSANQTTEGTGDDKDNEQAASETEEAGTENKSLGNQGEDTIDVDKQSHHNDDMDNIDADVVGDSTKEDEDVILTLSPAHEENMQGDEEVSESREHELLADVPVSSKEQTEDEESVVPSVDKDIAKAKAVGDEVDCAESLDGVDVTPVSSTSVIEAQADLDMEAEDEDEDSAVSKSTSVKDDNDNDKDTMSTATAEEEGSVGTNNVEDGEEGEDIDDSFLTAENMSNIAQYSQADLDGEEEADDSKDTPKTSKRGRKSKSFGASFVTEDEDLGLMIDREYKEKKTPMSGRGRPSWDTKLDLDLLRVPFEHGWRRELVQRNQKEGVNKAMDTYYHAPIGPKLRSMVQIAEYLAKHPSPLSTDNFSFARRCIYEPPYEIFRKANTGSSHFEKKMRGRGRGRGRGWSPGRGRPPLKRSPSSQTPSPLTPTIINVSPQKRKKGRPAKLSYPLPEVVIERDGEEDVADNPVFFNTEAEKPIKIVGTMSIKRSHSDVDDESSMETTVTPQPAKKKATARKSTTPRLAKPVSALMPPKPLGQLCTLQCPGLEGTPPNLQCAGCMCLFHSKCVNFQNSNSSGFLCLICAQDPTKKLMLPVTAASLTPSLISSPTETVGPSSVFSVSRSLFNPTTSTIIMRPNLTQNMNGRTLTTVDQSSQAIGALRSILDKRQPNLPNFSSLNIVTSVSPSIQTASMQNLLATTGMRTFSVGNTNSIVTQASSQTAVKPPTSLPIPSSGPIPTNLIRAAPPLTLLRPPPPPLQSKPAQMNTSSNPSLPPPRLTVAPGVLAPAPQECSLNQAQTSSLISAPSPKQSEIPLNAQLLTLPDAVTKRLKLSQPLALKINNIQIVVPPSCVINSSEGLKVLLPPSTFPIPSDPNAKLSVTVSNNTAGLEGEETKDSAGSVPTSTPSSGETDPPSKPPQPVLSSPSTRASKKRQAMGAASCYIKKLYGGYDCMLQIFEYLRTQDLLRASSVCRTWNKIATQPCLWRRVRLRSTVISDWESAALFFRKVRVESLCLQGMYHKHDRNRTWHLMIANLHEMVGLREIEFGHVPSTVLHQVCESLVNLEVFRAEYIAEINGDTNRNIPCKVDLGKFVCLKHLRELRLRGTGGLTLPAFSFNGGLAEIAALKNLQTLSLTSLKSIPDNEFHFLRDMKQLKFLELGNCNTWSSETYFVLGSLTSLVHLRLEYGGEIPDIGLGDALSNLNQLEELQLIHFSISETLYTTLQQLHNLSALVVWPEAADMAMVNTNTLTLVSKLQKLQALEWGVIVPVDSSSPDVENDRQAMWIPFFPPHYAQLQTESKDPVPVNKLSLIQLTESLAECLPNTDIKVKKIKSQAKVNGWTTDS